MSPVRGLLVICRMVKIEHSIFALPFAYAGAFLAQGGPPAPRVLVFLTLGMVAVRSFAMAVNRAADLPFDRRNPRTAGRPLVTGEIGVRQTMVFCAGMALLFVLSSAALNSLCLVLSLPTLGLAAAYSYAKRFTWLCHFVLGAVIGLAPIAGWLGVDPRFSPVALMLGLGVFFWIAGFDILYACQDVDFDRENGLYSLPGRFGPSGALLVSAFCHVNTTLFLFLAGLLRGLSLGWYVPLALAAGVLWLEHRLVKADDLSRLRLAFALNGPVSLLLLAGALFGTIF
ncbi:MAG: putative 4-hydroxybenzoate polyprenyltransferase [Desulfovibrio sp.]|jgi:4-hydroxybenzoate polyprenyltransferase|nr:putative 4-hydroxybenzoate polyprenyltransferase [Desulfovibrio sp.]